VWILFGAVAIHKAVMSFTSSVRFVDSLTSWSHVLLSVATLAVSSPAGVAIGLAVTDLGDGGPGTAVAAALLQGLAAGTFVYVTFFEVLYDHLSAHGGRSADGSGGGSDGRLMKILAVIIGFGCLTALELVTLKLTRD